MLKNNNYLSNKDYDFIFSKVPRLCVDLVVKTPKGIVLTYRKIEPHKNTWHLPGGRVFYQESLEQAAVRIAKSELGIKIKLGKFLGFIEFPKEKQDGKVRHSVSIVFLVTPISKNFISNWQAEKVGFFKTLTAKVHKAHGNFLKKEKILK